MSNGMSKPAIVRHACAVHGERLLAPAGMCVTCQCGRPCTVDVDAWVADILVQYPDEDIEELAAQAGIPAAQVRAQAVGRGEG